MHCGIREMDLVDPRKRLSDDKTVSVIFDSVAHITYRSETTEDFNKDF